ncbi:chaplin [Streptomyces flavofungini]|uniref:chaplin n=1 Tax=Streptomyces flavofungini TaxID=68200 RepID=UPI0034DE3D6E
MSKCRILAAAALTTIALIGGATTAGATNADPSPGAHASGAAVKSPGVLSGNVVQVPVSVPVNACGNTVDVVGILNPAAGNGCK